MDIKETARNYFNNRLNVTLEDVETLLQDVYDEGKETGAILYEAKVESKHQGSKEETINTQPHYDNTHGTLYKVGVQRKWNPYQFDVVKRIDRAERKGQFEEDLDKTIDVIKIWKRERKEYEE